MYELNGARFVERYVLTSIQNGSQPAPLNEPCLVHDLFQEIHGKPKATPHKVHKLEIKHD